MSKKSWKHKNKIPSKPVKSIGDHIKFLQDLKKDLKRRGTRMRKRDLTR